MSDTPRTDAELERNGLPTVGDGWIPSDFARQLERELAWTAKLIQDQAGALEATSRWEGGVCCTPDGKAWAYSDGSWVPLPPQA